jgi:hypothetical protein
MRFEQPAHARLQIAIKDWMEKELPESAVLYKLDDDGREGLKTEKRFISPNMIAFHAANAAYDSILTMFDVVGIAKKDIA